VAGALAGLVSLLIVAWLSRRFTDPLLEVATRTTAIAQGELIPLTVPERDDEVRDLILAINLMVRELGQLHQSIRHGEQLRTLGQLGAGFAHQLRNAALGARMALEFSDRDTTGGRDEESLRIAMAQLQRMELYLDRFLKLSQPRGLGEQAAVSGYVATERQSIRLDGLVESVLQLIEPMARHAHVAISQEPSPAMETELSGDVVALEQMLSNLVVNALEAAASGIGSLDAGNVPRPSPAVIVKASAMATRISIEVWDTGPGPPEGVAQTLFQPFVTTRPEGCGLGLTVAREIAVAHGGDITWRREKANGAAPWTVFQVTLAK
jgi:signal transduction histidine kinase